MHRESVFNRSVGQNLGCSKAGEAAVNGRSPVYEDRHVKASDGDEVATRASVNRLDPLLKSFMEVHSVGLGLAILDSECRYIDINEKLAELNGIPRDEHFGRSQCSIVTDIGPTLTRLARRALQTKFPVRDVKSYTVCATPTVPSERATGKKLTSHSLIGPCTNGTRALTFTQTMPETVRSKLALAMSPEWDAAQAIVIAPTYGPSVPKDLIAGDFLRWLTQLATVGSLRSDSPFVSSAISSLSSYLQSPGAGTLSPKLDFLTRAAKGLETEIATAMKFSLE